MVRNATFSPVSMQPQELISELRIRQEIGWKSDLLTDNYLVIISDPVIIISYCTVGDKELVGTLRGFDVFVNMVLEQVEAYEATPEGTRVTKLDQILLNGNNIAILVPGGRPDQ